MAEDQTDAAGSEETVPPLHGFMRGSVIAPPDFDFTQPVLDEASAEHGELLDLWRAGIDSGESEPLDVQDVNRRGRERLSALRSTDL